LPDIGCPENQFTMATKSLKKEDLLEIQSKYNRSFSDVFRKEKVKEITEKRVTIQQICDLYGVSRTSVYKWIYLYSPHHHRSSKQVVQMESEATKTQQLLHKVAELERIVGQKQMEIDYLNQLIVISSEELSVDLKKNFARKTSNGSADTPICTGT
jgi:transposase